MVVPRHNEIDITVGRVAELVVAKLTRHVGVSPGGYGGGDIVIPVYIGQERIDEIIVNATNRVNYKSGGRT